MVWLGEISYAVYMVPFGVILVATRALFLAGLSAPGATLSLILLSVCIIGVIAVAAAAFYCIERPARRLMRTWWSRRQSSGIQRPQNSPRRRPDG